MIQSQSQFLFTPPKLLLSSPSSLLSPHLPISPTFPRSTLHFPIHRHTTTTMTSNSPLSSSELDHFADVANKLADAAGDVIRKYFRKSFDILDKEDLSPVTIADQAAEASMVSIIQQCLPSHAIYGEENGWQCKEKSADYVWVLDPIDGTKSFITGKPLFGTLIALLHKGKPVKISNPGYRDLLKCHYMAATVIAYALLASGHVDLVIESGLKPYDFLSLVPVIEGAGGVITDWRGHQLHWEASANSQATSFNVLAAGDKQLHQLAVDSLDW